MSEHQRKTKEERGKTWSDMNSYWAVSLMYWEVPSQDEFPKYTNLYLRIAAGYFDYNLLRAEVKRLLGTDRFVLLNRWRAVPSEYRSYVQVFTREVSSMGTGHYGAFAEDRPEARESGAENI